MSLKQKIKNRPWLYNSLLALLNATHYFDWQFHRRFRKYKLEPHWEKRIATVRNSSDNQKLKHVPNAGEVFENYQLMGNGLKITLGSYYDYGNTHLLIANKGVHEPQEEFAFSEILPLIPAGGTMMELGSYWAFYSMWFARDVRDSKCFMIEPDPHKMNFGKLNFKMNGLSGTFDNGYITNKTDLRPAIPFYSVDFLMEKHKITHLNILHSDIQGFEFKMLQGCATAMRDGSIDYFFISTHSNELHDQCIQALLSFDYTILCDANLDESYSVDGLIVAKRGALGGPEKVEISKK
jgi:hypothetical protein